MEAKKKTAEIPAKSVPVPALETQPIRLRPSSSDYETFARTTAIAMGKTAPTASELKPNKRLLLLLNLGS